MKKRLLALLLTLVLAAGVIAAVWVYARFASQTIYEESTAHLSEVFHQANQRLYNQVSLNWSRIRMWAPHITSLERDQDVYAYVKQAQEEANFTDFYFISREGEYINLSGRRGYLDMRQKLSDLMLAREDVIVNSVVPNQPEIMVFAVPTEPGDYLGFDYAAMALTFNNADLVNALKISAFGGLASTFAVQYDGWIMVNSSVGDMRGIHNILYFLEGTESLSAEKLAALRQDLLSGKSGSLLYEDNGQSYYMVYEPVDFENWMVVGTVPEDVVNENMNRLLTMTLTVIVSIALVLSALLFMLIIRQNRKKLRRKDRELLSRDELFSKLSINVDDVFLMLNADDLHAEYVSSNIEKLLGLTEQQVRDDIFVCRRLLAPEETVTILDKLPDLQPGQQIACDREYIHQQTGEKLWFQAMVFCTDIQGEIKYILDLSDRTKEKRINQRLEDAVHAAEQANQAKTVFLNSMSHDIRTPMNAIIGFTNIAMKQNHSPEVDASLHKILSSSEHLLTLINDVLDISRIESGKIQLMPVPVNIATIDDIIVSITQGFLSNRHIDFQVKREPIPTPYVLADDVRIREVLVNILSNAVKFTNDGGTIRFEVSWLPGADEKHIQVVYRIADTGIGMTEEFLSRIFDEFSQEGTDARTQYKGTGLGMAICKKYVDMMGGTITVESQKGVGSTFTVVLPLELTDEHHVPQQSEVTGVKDLTGVSILLAEDNDLNAEIATELLGELGIQITRAANGREAVAIFGTEAPGSFDMIFMDIMMPEMNGYEATKAIRTMAGRPDAAEIPIIAMTANAFAEDVQASVDAGMNGHLTKPIVIEQVVNAISLHLRR